MYGIFNLKYGSTRICIYHLQPGVWEVQKWTPYVDKRHPGGWAPMPHISNQLAMRMYFALRDKNK